jgi:hypothetical protein
LKEIEREGMHSINYVAALICGTVNPDWLFQLVFSVVNRIVVLGLLGIF